jgi:hypothetical protein
VTLTYQGMPLPVAKPQKIKLGGSDDIGLKILIVSAKEPDAKMLDDAVNPLLAEYGYDVVVGRSEFRGTWFISYKSTKKTPDLEKDFELFFGSDPKNPTQPGAQLPAEKPEKWKKLKDFLETGKAFIIVGTLLVGTLGALKEFSDEIHKTFDHTPTLIAPAPQLDKRLQKIQLQPSLVRIDAEKNTRLFERSLNTEVDRHLQRNGFVQKKTSKTERHLEQ